MPRSTPPCPARTPGTTSPTAPRRRRSRAVVTTLVAALAVGVAPALTAPAAEAAPVATATTAATAPTTTTKITVRRSTTSTYEGRRGARLTIRLTSGAPVDGRVKIYDGSKLLRSIRAADKNDDGRLRVTYRLPKRLKAGKHRIVVRYVPSASTTARKASTATKVRVRPEGELVARAAKRLVGTPYRSGGTTPRGFDCSGFTSYVFKKAGVAKLPRSSSAQRHAGKVVSRAKARTGDLIWTPGHVAIYLGDGKQIDAPRPGKAIKVRGIWQSNPVFIRV